MSVIYYKCLSDEANAFANSAYDMVSFNFNVFEWEMEPKTAKSFYLTLGYKGQERKELFRACDIKGSNGIFKLAKMIAELSR